MGTCTPTANQMILRLISTVEETRTVIMASRITAASSAEDWAITDEIKVGVELGRGSYGRVCVGEWKGARVAVKMLHDIFREVGIPDADLAVFLQKFAEEWETMKSLRHPNILQLFGVSNPKGGWPMMIMELMKESLEHRLQEGPLSSNAQLFVLHGIACGLRYLHERPRPVVHRDLASKNILVSQDVLQVKIGDLGVAKALTDLHSTHGTTMPGTELYMPPEARSGVAPRASLDMFSFGVIMIEVIVGRLPSPLPLLVIDSGDPNRYRVLSETERREIHLNDIPEGNNLRPIIIQTLGMPGKRPTASQMIPVLSRVMSGSDHEDGQSHAAIGSSRITDLEEENERLRVALSAEMETNGKEVARLMTENEATLIEKHAAVAQLRESVRAKDDELSRLRLQPQRDETSSSIVTRLRWLSERWQTSQAPVRTNTFARWFDAGWKYSTFDMPYACVPVTTVHDNRILVGDRSSGEMFLYDVNSYQYVGSRRFPHDGWTFEGLAVHCGQIYAHLYDEKNYQLGLYNYDICEDRWTKLFRKPGHHIMASSMVMAGNKIFIIGGFDFRYGTGKSGAVFSYDLVSQKWETVSATPTLTKRHQPACAVSNAHLFIAGGRTGSGSTSCNTVEVLSLETGHCRSIHSMNCSKESLAANHTGLVIATGGVTPSAGYRQPHAEKTVELYDFRSESPWIPLPSLPRPRVIHGSCFLPNAELSLLLAGGYKYDKGYSQRVPWIDIIGDPIHGAS